MKKLLSEPQLRRNSNGEVDMLSQEQRAVKFRDLDWGRVSEAISGPSSTIQAAIKYMFVWLQTVGDFIFVVCTFIVYILLFPRYGIIDSQWHGMTDELAVPQGYLRYCIVFTIGMLMFVQMLVDVISRGVFRQKSVAATMANPLAYRIVSLRSYNKYQLMLHTQRQMPVRMTIMAWVVWISQGWRRFLMLRLPLAGMYCALVTAAATAPYTPPSSALQLFAILYMSLVIAGTLFELMGKSVALMVYASMLAAGDVSLRGKSVTLEQRYMAAANEQLKQLTKDYTLGDFALPQLPNEDEAPLQIMTVTPKSNYARKQSLLDVELNSPLLSPPKSPGMNTWSQSQQSFTSQGRKKSPNRVRFERTFHRERR